MESFRNAERINLPFCKHQGLQLWVAVVHSKQDWLAPRFRPFLVVILGLIEVGLAVLDELHLALLVKERNDQNLVIIVLYSNAISHRYFFTDSA